MYSQNEATIQLLPLNRSRIEEQGVSIRDTIDLLIEGRKIILAALLTVLLATVVYLVLAPRTYKADALLRIDKNKALLAAPLRSEANGAPTEADNPRAQREVEILRSRSVLGKVVDDLNLTVEYSPYYFPLIGETLAQIHLCLTLFMVVSYKAALNRQQWGWGQGCCHLLTHYQQSI